MTAAAGTGIGFSAARRAALEGADVLVSDFHERRMNEARDALAALRADGRVLAVLVVVGVALPLLAAAGLLELAVRALVAACTVLVALALWQAEHTDYAAILLDIMLPGLNGYRVCARLRAAQNWTPIIMLTAKDGEYDEADALDAGADDYVTTPLSRDYEDG